MLVRPAHPRLRGVSGVQGLLAALLLLLGLPALADVTAALEPNPALPGETVTLTLVQSPPGRDRPRLELPPGLSEISRQQSQNTRIINGQRSSDRRWTITLAADGPGEYPIRVAPMDGLPVPSLELTVLQPQPGSAQSAEVFASFTADTQQTWVGAEVALHLRVYVAGELESGSLPDPAAPGLLIEKISENNDAEEIIGGTRYRVIDRRYVAFAENPGPLTIPGPVFSGRVIDRRNGRSSAFSRFSVPTRRIGVRAEDIRLEVRPAQRRDDAAWLPARRVTLEQTLDLPRGQPERGQAFSRSVRLRVAGQLHTQLPDLNWPLPERAEAQSYVEQEQSQTQALGDGVRAELLQRFVYIPQGDRLTLPALRLPWFNIDSGRWEVAELAAQTLDVRRPLGVYSEPDTTDAAPPPSPTDDVADQADPGSRAEADPAVAADLRLWRALAIAASVGWLVSLLGWWRLRRRLARPSAAAVAAPAAQRRADRAAALRAIRDGDAPAARDALLAWGVDAGLLPPHCGPGALLQLAEAVGEAPLATELRRLSAQIYGRGSWSPEALAAALRAWQPPKTPRAGRDSALPPLYPPER